MIETPCSATLLNTTELTTKLMASIFIATIAFDRLLFFALFSLAAEGAESWDPVSKTDYFIAVEWL